MRRVTAAPGWLLRSRASSGMLGARRHLASIPDELRDEKTSRVRRLGQFKPARAKDVALHPGDDPSTMAVPSGDRPEDAALAGLTPGPSGGADNDDISPHVREDVAPRAFEREHRVAETRRSERLDAMPRGFRSWEEVAKAEATRIHKVAKEQERRWEQHVLSKPLRIALPKPGRASRRSSSALQADAPQEGAAGARGGAAGGPLSARARDLDLPGLPEASADGGMEAPRAVAEVQQRKSLRLARIAAHMRRALSAVLAERRVREPGLYPLGLPLHVVEVEIAADLRVARVRWQLPVLGAGGGGGAAESAAAEWRSRAEATLSRGAERKHPGRRRREAVRAERAAELRTRARATVRAEALRAGLEVPEGDSDLDDEGEDGLSASLQRRLRASSPSSGFGGDALESGGLGAFLRQSAATEGAASAAEALREGGVGGGDEGGELSWRLDRSVLQRQLVQWRSAVRAGTRKPTIARVMRWAEEAAVPREPEVRAAFKEAQAALDRRAPELRRQVGARVPLRVLPRLEFHPWLGLRPSQLLNAAREGLAGASRRGGPEERA